MVESLTQRMKTRGLMTEGADAHTDETHQGMTVITQAERDPEVRGPERRHKVRQFQSDPSQTHTTDKNISSFNQ